ncbi:MAG: glycosyltransferase, partial [Candidatus Omnitrophica bacterium]|nr:glycosyltransferase [Candidatus Omnitrophota bacterium]
MEKIKVIRIITRMNIGGPAIQAALLTTGLNRDKFDSTLLTGAICENEGDMTYLVAEQGIEPILIAELQREVDIVKDIKGLWKICRYLKKNRPDIIHTHTAKAGAIGRIAAILAGVPVIIHTFHGHVFHSYF